MMLQDLIKGEAESVKRPKLKFSVKNWPLDDIKPAKSYIPNWYKKSPQFLDDNKPMIRNYDANRSMKLCVPLIDAMTTGYMIETWNDIQVTKVDNNGNAEINIAWMHPPDPIVNRDNITLGHFPFPAGCNTKYHFAWRIPWYIKLPKGYSAYLVHPINRFDLPFITVSGIVDLDIGLAEEANIPFFLRDDFEGIIPKGTPILQIIPFKRENWTSSNDPSIVPALDKHKFDSNSIIRGNYRNKGWKKKDYT